MRIRKYKILSVQRVGLVLGPMFFVLIYLFFRPEGMSVSANAILASTAWISIWWITEAIPVPVTSLLPLILFPVSGGLGIESTAAAFGHRLIFLFMGGFVLALAIERWGLHKRIALSIIRLVGSSMRRIILGFMLATAFMSMWISNTATSVMMLPIGMAIISQWNDKVEKKERVETVGKTLMLAIAYAASIGGLATLIGTPPNLVFAGVIQDMYGVEISFARWMVFGLPLSLLLLMLCWYYLVHRASLFHSLSFPGGRAEIKRQWKALGKMSYEERVVGWVFMGTALAWISRPFVLCKLSPSIDDTIIALAGAVLLFILPARSGKGRSLMDWEAAVKLPWGIILLFGGGLALAEGFSESGLANWIGSQMTLLEGISFLLILLVLVGAVNFLTEITSNLATTSMILPILAPMALGLDIHPFFLMTGATLAASCAFMLPVATPPNAVVFGSGMLRMSDMMKTGVWMNLLSIVVVTLAVYCFLGFVWGMDFFHFPVEWKEQ